MDNLKSKNRMNEKLVECSGVSEEGIWSPHEDVCSSTAFFPTNPLVSMRSLREIKLSLLSQFEMISAEKIFDIHKQNFFDRLEAKDVEDLLSLIEGMYQ